MDGIAIASAAYVKGQRRFWIEGMQKAGEPQRQLSSQEGCLEVMTGAVLPHGVDCVVPVEEISVSEGYATLLETAKGGRAVSPPKPNKHVHLAGSDCAAGDIIVPAGLNLTAPHLGAAAAFGCSTLQVAYAPSVAIVATGDELVDPSAEPLGHQIRKSNPYAIAAALQRCGVDRITHLHAPDERDALRKCIESQLGNCDMLILTGGVSMGKLDFVPGVLADLGIRASFHKIRHKPGKPFWFGVGPNGLPVFALPGNPASVLVCLCRYVLPALRKAMGGKASMPMMAALDHDVPAPGNLTHFRPATILHTLDGSLHATLVAQQGSGDFSGWAKSDGFIELVPGDALLTAGSVVRFWSWPA